jgi:hypothetical protein
MSALPPLVGLSLAGAVLLIGALLARRPKTTVNRIATFTAGVSLSLLVAFVGLGIGSVEGTTNQLVNAPGQATSGQSVQTSCRQISLSSDICTAPAYAVEIPLSSGSDRDVWWLGGLACWALLGVLSGFGTFRYRKNRP